MVAVSESEIRVMSDDTRSELVLPIREDFEFGYGDMRHHPQHADEFDKILIVFFPFKDNAHKADIIVFTEIVER